MIVDADDRVVEEAAPTVSGQEGFTGWIGLGGTREDLEQASLKSRGCREPHANTCGAEQGSGVRGGSIL